MDPSVSLPDPGDFDRGHHNGHAPGLVTHQLHPYDPADSSDGFGGLRGDTDLPGDRSILPLHPADIAELLATPGRELDPNVVDEQTRALEAELRAELDRLDTADESGSYCNLAQEKEDGKELLPGFETLTGGDLLRARLGLGNQVPDQRENCPAWCAYASLPRHGDGFDTTPEAEIPHRGVPHDIPVHHGGEGLDHGGSAQISLQVEQQRDLATGPVITLSVVIGGIEQYAWLTTTEARTLQRTLGQLLDDTADDG